MITDKLIKLLNEAITGSEQQLKSFRGDLAKSAQKIYDDWDQSGEDGDPELGFGGICQDIAAAMADVLTKKKIECTTVSAQIGEQHVWVVAKVKDGVFNVDISPYKYEKGSGYNWTKIDGVKIGPNDVSVEMIDDNPEKFDEYTEE
jgi:hypothetical protein